MTGPVSNYPTLRQAMLAAGISPAEAREEEAEADSSRLDLRKAARDGTAQAVEELLKQGIFFFPDLTEPMRMAAAANQPQNFRIFRLYGGRLELDHSIPLFRSCLERGWPVMLSQLVTESVESGNLDLVVENLSHVRNPESLHRRVEDFLVHAHNGERKFRDGRWEIVAQKLELLAEKLKSKLPTTI